MALRTALFWGVVQTGFRMLLSFLSIKVTAVVLGPTGLALTGQLGNFISLLQGGLGNAIQTGVVKLTAESESDRDRRLRILRAGLWMSILLAVPVGAVITIFAAPLSLWLLDTKEYWPIIVLVGVVTVIVVLRLPFDGSLNGHKRIRDVSLSLILTNIAGAALFIPLAWFFGVWGGLVGTVLSVAVAFPVLLIVFRKAKLFRWEEIYGAWEGNVAREIFLYFPMVLAHSVVAPFALILVRNVLRADLGIEAVGFWQAIWRISDMYTSVLLTSLSLFLMPHLSSCREDDRFARELFGISTKAAILTALPALGIYLFRDTVTAVVFTKAFAPVHDLFGWQLTGDVLKMAGWPLRMALLIKHRAKPYIMVEVSTPLMHAEFTHLLVSGFGTNAATIGYVLSYLISDVVAVIALRDYLWRVFGATRRQPG